MYCLIYSCVLSMLELRNQCHGLFCTFVAFVAGLCVFSAIMDILSRQYRYTVKFHDACLVLMS